jgi:hypothetical protein
MIKTQQVINSIVSNKTGNMTNDAVQTYCIYYNKSENKTKSLQVHTHMYM